MLVIIFVELVAMRVSPLLSTMYFLHIVVYIHNYLLYIGL